MLPSDSLVLVWISPTHGERREPVIDREQARRDIANLRSMNIPAWLARA